MHRRRNPRRSPRHLHQHRRSQHPATAPGGATRVRKTAITSTTLIISKFREAEEARSARRTIPVATYAALGMIAVVYAGAAWAMAAHAGDSRVVAAAARQGPGLLFGLGGSGALSQVAQWLFLT